MSWIKNLYDTYDSCSNFIGNANDSVPLLPLCHSLQNAHIQIDIDGDGQFLRARVIQKEQALTIIPCTEDSAGRVGSRPKNHPLCDNLQYIAKDFLQFGGVVTSGYLPRCPRCPRKEKPKALFLETIQVNGDYHQKLKCSKCDHIWSELQEPFCSYFKELSNWCSSAHSHKKIESIFKYVKKGHVINDLLSEKVLFTDEQNKLLFKTKSELKDLFGLEENIPPIFRVILPDQLTKLIDQGGSFIRWSVQMPGDSQANVWTDETLWTCWANYHTSQETGTGLCYVTGNNAPLAKSHPKRIRKGSDGAKLISSNDNTDYTFRGRFINDSEACGVSSEVTQKAHDALRWLIGRDQAFKNGDQVIVSWALTGDNIPDPFSNSFDLFGAEDTATESAMSFQADAGQAFSQRLNKYIAGYSAKLGSTNKIVVLGLDSASPGRLSITYYRELAGSEFLKRIEAWHSDLAWKQRITIDEPTQKRGGKQKFICLISAPAPKDIAKSAYGFHSEKDKNHAKLIKATIERLLPSIIDGAPLPIDLVKSAFHIACNRAGLEHWKWEKALGVACSIYKAYYLRNPNEQRSYSMALEPERTTRDYLYGRLLAAADLLESVALHVTEKNRPTTAARFMQRFADRPYSTWRTIELALSPYKVRLKKGTKYEKAISKVTNLFKHDDYVSDKSLTGEFLLGFHCQREDFKVTAENSNEKADSEINETVERE